MAIGEDGPATPCRACLMRIVDGVRDPGVLSDMERTMLLEAHGDSVLLIAHKGRYRWARQPGR